MTPTEEIRAARHRLAAKFDNDLSQIVADLQRQERESDASFVSFPRRQPKSSTVASSSNECKD
jgi:hypothetical protein